MAKINRAQRLKLLLLQNVCRNFLIGVNLYTSTELELFNETSEAVNHVQRLQNLIIKQL